MTSLALPKPKLTRAEKLTLLRDIAKDGAPTLYKMECALLGMADTAAPFASLAEHQQAVYRERAIVTVLSGLGWVAGKARDKAIVASLNDAEADNGGQFAQSARRLLETVAANAVGRVDGLLQAAWLELER